MSRSPARKLEKKAARLRALFLMRVGAPRFVGYHFPFLRRELRPLHPFTVRALRSQTKKTPSPPGGSAHSSEPCVTLCFMARKNPLQRDDLIAILERRLAMNDNPHAWGICLACFDLVRTPHRCPGTPPTRKKNGNNSRQSKSHV